jgi:hypothetical protein
MRTHPPQIQTFDGEDHGGEQEDDKTVEKDVHARLRSGTTLR